MDERRQRVKAMLRLIAGSAQGFSQGVKQAAEQNPKLALALERDPELLARTEDGIMDDLVPLYAPLDDAAVAAVTEFYSSPAGRALAAQMKASAGEQAQLLEGWQQRLLLAVASLTQR